MSVHTIYLGFPQDDMKIVFRTDPFEFQEVDGGTSEVASVVLGVDCEECGPSGFQEMTIADKHIRDPDDDDITARVLWEYDDATPKKE